MEAEIEAVWPLFVVAILMLFLFGAVTALRHTRRYRSVEGAILDHVAFKLKQLQERQGAPAAEGELPAAEAPKSLIAPADLLENVPIDSLIGDRIGSILKMRQSHVKVSLNALQHMTLAREAAMRWLALPAFAANLSMMLGLFGTVVGLSFVVQQIGAGLPTDSGHLTLQAWMASINQIRGVLSGMKTAFAATMTGLGSAIILSWLNHRLSRAQAALLDRLDRFTTEELLPATVAATEDESLLEKISLQLELSFARLDDAAQSNRATLQELSAVEKGLLEIVDSVRQSTQSEQSARTQELMKSLLAVIEQVAKLNQNVVGITDAIPDLAKQAQGANTAYLTRLDRMIGLFEEQGQWAQWSRPAKMAVGLMGSLNALLVFVLVWR